MYYTNKRPRSFPCWIAICTIALTIVTFILIASKYFNLIQVTKDFFSEAKFEEAKETRLVCYYTKPNPEDNTTNSLRLNQIDVELCTHINLGVLNIGENASIELSEDFKRLLKDEVPDLKKANEKIKLLLWIGGGGSDSGFTKMIVKHDTRKLFLKSLKEILRTYKLDGVDLDWEFPRAYNKERIHFSQLLYELRQEFKREKRNYLLSIAVAADEGIALFAYDIREINLYADYVNLMTYDYHFYSKSTPFTGLNAPLYARENEHSILATLNINYSVNWWLSNGLERHKLVVGLPTYGHTYKLVNPFNNGLVAPAEDFGSCGQLGFATYSEICWFMAHNPITKNIFDSNAASPYIASINEWISFENQKSIAIKTQYIRSLKVGGAMAFSLNTDDIDGYCSIDTMKHVGKKPTFPLITMIKKNLFT